LAKEHMGQFPANPVASTNTFLIEDVSYVVKQK